MSQTEVFPSQAEWRENAHVKQENYESLYKKSIEFPDAFWTEQAERLKWIKKWDKVSDCQFKSPVKVSWFEGGQLNVSANCIDRHLEKHGDKTAIIWEPDSPDEKAKTYSFRQLHAEVSKMANVYKKLGVKKGDRVTIYLPMIPEAAFAMLACARIGAIHSVVFAGFSPDALADRILGCDSDFLITADEGLRGGKKVPLKVNANKAMETAGRVKACIVVQRSGAEVEMKSERDHWYHEISESVANDCEPEVMDAEDPLFILYTSGSTNKPKGVLHTSAGYLLYTALTHQYVFDYHEGDVYWCAADVGWITGHSYMVYGPLANGATTVLYEGVPNWPDASRIWQVVDKHKVNILYTAPTAIRALMKDGAAPVKKTNRSSLKVLGSVGEPINPEAWLWYFNEVGEGKCPIVDTWWQTETGGILITPLPGASDLKPGSALKPFFGIQPVVLDPDGNELEGEAQGYLAMKGSWPGQMRSVYKDHSRFESTYFSQASGYYFTGDGCKRDRDGDYWITGRVDDVLNCSGHRMGTAEIESALVQHESVVEAAVVGYPHEVKGQGIYCFVTLLGTALPSDQLEKELIDLVRSEIGPFAKPDLIQWAPALPKTRSGKIMRRILRKIAEDDVENIGDTSTLADSQVVENLIASRKPTKN